MQEEKPPGGSSGELQGVHYFNCQKDHGIFLPLEMLKRDDRFDSIKSTELAVQEMNISGSDAEPLQKMEELLSGKSKPNCYGGLPYWS